ncbi:MAG: hypothetical protein AB9891_20655 [Anaerolineaceae bacterium]
MTLGDFSVSKLKNLTLLSGESCNHEATRSGTSASLELIRELRSNAGAQKSALKKYQIN